MGAKLTVRRRWTSPEPAGDVVVYGSVLRGIVIKQRELPAMIDELPLLALAAARAEGTTVIHGAVELRHKESDRLKSTFALFRALGLRISFGKNRLVIKGPQAVTGGRPVETFNDHRIAMAAAVGALLAGKPVRIKGPGCVDKSYPAFFRDFKKVFG
jgi:3-phosphoshikimate 1-carboxyvinyltransferase